MTVTIVETRAVTGGVDTHADVHVAAALDPIGGLLGVQEFPATPAGYARLLGWLGGFGTVCLVGIEGTGSYGAGLARHITAAGVRVVEVDRSDRQDRRRAGKSDPLDAVSAARAAQSGPGPRRAEGPGRRGGGDPGADGRQAQRPRRADPDDQPGPGADPDRPRRPAGPVRPAHPGRAWSPSWPRCGPAPATSVGYATRIALRELGRRAEFLDGQLERLDELIVPLVTARAPGLLALYGVGPDTAALLLVAAGDHPERLRSEAAWAHLCATAPIPASSGKRHPPPAQPRRRPPGQPRPVADRDHPDELPPAHPRLRRAGAPKKACPRKKSSAASSVTSPARSTPTCARPPADAQLPGTAWPANRLPHTCWPANDSPAVPGPITCWA